MGKDGHGNTLLSMMAAERYRRTVSLSLDRGARINIRTLLARGADKEAEDRDGGQSIDLLSQSHRNAQGGHTRWWSLQRRNSEDSSLECSVAKP